MEHNEKPNVFPDDNAKDSGPSKEEFYAQQMRERREKEVEDRKKPVTPEPAKPIENSLSPSKSSYKVEPDFDSDFDVVSLPSEGKTYKSKKGKLKISYLNASDENILSNPNLITSGKFLDILFERKILETDISYEELLTGDRDAIMIWLRATAYGTNYPIEVMDPETLEPFETEIDLADIEVKKLGAEPDEDGLFSFTLPSNKKLIKFKLLTVGDVKEVEDHKERMTKEKGEDFSDLATHTLKKIIVEIDGDRDRTNVGAFVERMRLGDSKALKKYLNDIESGMDLMLTVTAPGGGLVKTFFPLNPAFFWPES